METSTNKELRVFIMKFFNDSELEAFCFDYFPDVQNNFTIGMEKNNKVMQMMQYCRNRQLMANLLVNLQQERPQPYQTTFAAQETIPAPPPPKTKPRNPNQVFISYATTDAADLANKLAANLRANNHPVWIAPTSIAPGEKWDEAIQRGLQESGIFLLLLTPAAVNSYWVKKEMRAAMRLEEYGQMKIWPLDVQACDVDIFWKDYQFISFRDAYANGWSRLCQALGGVSADDEEVVYSRSEKQAVTAAIKTDDLVPPVESIKHISLSIKDFLGFTRRRVFTHEKTGLKFVHIPDGEFVYGRGKEKRMQPEFWISKTPVTHAVYKRFIDANPKHGVPYIKTGWLKGWPKQYNWDKYTRIYQPDKAKHPVVLVSWYDAVAFCKWAGLELPTQEQWEKAARGGTGWKYTWGDDDPINKRLCNFNSNISRTTVNKTTAVGNYSPQGDSPYNCVDMIGNVWEWCLNKYGTPEDIDIDQSSADRVMRGGSWRSTYSFVTATSRSSCYPDDRRDDVGFRVVTHHFPSQ